MMSSMVPFVGGDEGGCTAVGGSGAGACVGWTTGPDSRLGGLGGTGTACPESSFAASFLGRPGPRLMGMFNSRMATSS